MRANGVVLHDPTSESASERRPRVAPPATLDGKTVALFDIGKIRSDEFLDYVEPRLTDRGIRVLRAAKPTNATPAPQEVIEQVVEGADVVVGALAD